MRCCETDIQVEIDRLVLRGMEMTPERAEQLKSLVESELQRLLQATGLEEGFASQEITVVEAPAIESPELYDEHRLAQSLAQRIVECVQPR